MYMDHMDRKIIIYGCEVCENELGVEIQIKSKLKDFKKNTKFIDEFILEHENCGIELLNEQ